MKTIRSSLGDIYIGQVNEGLKELIHSLDPSSICILADDHTAKLCVPKVLSEIGSQVHTIVIEHGEKNKNLDSCQAIWSELIKSGADRQSLILNVGGGMICDLGGFAASCYQRGIRFANIPTTVLAMTDAAVGGKTGIDFDGFKNYIGLMNQPSFIWIDWRFINTLPETELISGSAEIVKHAIIAVNPLWDILTAAGSLKNLSWEDVFKESIGVKISIVEDDYNERAGRKKLNFGHTVGHALESHFLRTTDPLSHGQCVAIGMLIESKMANLKGMLNNQDFNAIVLLVDHLLSPVQISLPTFAGLKPQISRDKKTKTGVVGYSLPDAIGSCQWDVHVDDQVGSESFHWYSTHEQAGRERLIAE